MFRYFLLTFFVIFGADLLAQKNIPPRPDRLVNDYADLLRPQEEAALERKLVAYDDSTSTQIAIVIDESLEGEDAFDYSNRLARAWGIGGSENDNGILIYISKADRKFGIQTGYGVEHYLPDVMSKRIIDNVVVPNFREGRFYEGLNRATDIMIDLGNGEYQSDGSERPKADGLTPFLMILFIILIIVIISRASAGDDDDDDGGYYRGGRYDMDDYAPRRRRRRRGGGWIFIPGGGFGGGNSWTGGGGLGGGGGFGGFGGGDFGGGGAFGDW